MHYFILLARELEKDPALSQRSLAALSRMSLGMVNKTLQKAQEKGLLYKKEGGIFLSEKGLDELQRHQVDNAVIFAAGFGSRFVPLTFETPKGLLKVYGERMIERQIKQLHACGITDITIAVGYLKEKFEYLIDKFGVKLLYNPEYATKNTLSTLWHCRELFAGRNTYLLSSDNWLRENLFHSHEAFSWYSSVYMEGKTGEWVLQYNKQGCITDVQIGGRDSYVMYGPVYMSRSFSEQFLPLIQEYYEKEGTQNDYWENVFLYALQEKRLGNEALYINKQEKDVVYEFENLEELRAFDESYRHRSDNEAMALVAEVFQVPESKICRLRCLKSGMTNKSFLFDIEGKSYICRIPGKGTEKLIDRQSEYRNYEAIRSLGISEEIIYFNKDSGYKIAKYYEGSHNASAENPEGIRACMDILRRLHGANLQVEHKFDLRERISFYEALCEESGGIGFEDHEQVKANMMGLYEKLQALNRKSCLSHIDSVFDNFIFTVEKGVKLIDWEYAAMSDPLIDISMMAIYAYFNREQADMLMELYFERQPVQEEAFAVYAYMALGGYLWALWAVYKSNLGEQFGEYTLKMYRYAKDYDKIALEVYKDMLAG